MSKPLKELAADIGEVYFIEKDAKTELGELRGDFFLAAAVAQKAKSLARKTFQVPESIPEDQARDFVEKYNSGWHVVSNKGSKYTIEEDPEFKPYTVVVPVEDLVDSKDKPHPGYKVVKTIVTGSLMLDDERLQADNYPLYEDVTTFPNYDALADMLYEAGVEPDDIDERLEQAGLPRVLKNLDDLTPELNEQVKPYVYEGPKSTRLNVSYAKEEELGEEGE